MREENWNIRGKISQSRVDNQQTQLTYGVEYRIEFRQHWWEASALTTVPALFYIIYEEGFFICSQQWTSYFIVGRGKKTLGRSQKKTRVWVRVILVLMTSSYLPLLCDISLDVEIVLALQPGDNFFSSLQFCLFKACPYTSTQSSNEEKE